MKTIAIIQARMGSTRLPGKVLADIEGRPMIWYVAARAAQATCLDLVVVAVPQTPADEALQTVCQGLGIPCASVPNEDDVLARYRAVAHDLKADVVVRLTADCPLIDPRLIDLVVWCGLEQRAIYSSNIFPVRTFPDGLDVEVLPMSAIDMMDASALDVRDREHVTPMVQRHAQRTNRYAAIAHDPPLGDLRWTVDTPEDLAFVREMYRQMAPRWDFTWEEVLALGELAYRRAA